MKKFFFILITFLISESIALWYSPFNAREHQLLDQQLALFSGQSLLQKQKKAEEALRLAHVLHTTRQAFEILPDLKYWFQLDKEGEETAQEYIKLLTSFKLDERNASLAQLKTTELFALELERALNLTMGSGFEGYAIAKMPTPLFWYPLGTANISKSLWGPWFTGLNLDKQNLIREVAVVVPEGTVFTLISKREWDAPIYQVRTREFDAGSGSKQSYFVDARFIEKVENKPQERIANLPDKETILSNMKSMLKSAYVRGWSRYQGIPQLEARYPSSNPLSNTHQQQKTLKGVDCSGLLYQATDTYTPRNTRQLLKFGDPISIEGLNSSQIIQKLQPLDIIVWAGHIVIVYDQQWAIESRRRPNFAWGVEMVSLKSRLDEIMKNRTAVNDYESSSLPSSKKFVIRRRHPASK